MKKIIFNKHQVTEVIGADFSYLDKDDNDFNFYNSDNEIVTSDQLSNDIDGEPITTDKYASQLAPRYFYGHRDVRGTVSCNKINNKNILDEENENLKNKTFKIPDNLYSYLKNLLKKYSTNKEIKGFKRLNNLIKTRNINTNEMYQLKNRLDKLDKSDEEYNVIGGDELKKWIDKELNLATTIDYRSKDIKRQMGDTNAFIKSHNKEYGNDGAHSNFSQSVKKDVKFNYE